LSSAGVTCSRIWLFPQAHTVVDLGLSKASRSFAHTRVNAPPGRNFCPFGLWDISWRLVPLHAASQSGPCVLSTPPRFPPEYSMPLSFLGLVIETVAVLFKCLMTSYFIYLLRLLFGLDLSWESGTPSRVPFCQFGPSPCIALLFICCFHVVFNWQCLIPLLSHIGSFDAGVISLYTDFTFRGKRFLCSLSFLPRLFPFYPFFPP